MFYVKRKDKTGLLPSPHLSRTERGSLNKGLNSIFCTYVLYRFSFPHPENNLKPAWQDISAVSLTQQCCIYSNCPYFLNPVPGEVLLFLFVPRFAPQQWLIKSRTNSSIFFREECMMLFLVSSVQRSKWTLPILYERRSNMKRTQKMLGAIVMLRGKKEIYIKELTSRTVVIKLFWYDFILQFGIENTKH